MRTRVLLLIALIGALATATGAAGASAVAQPPFKVVMTGLDNPRGLDWGPDGALYVVEAGKGGTQPCFGPDSGEFAGFTGAISRLKNNVQTRVATGLPSHASQDGSFALGPHNIAFVGNAFARVTIGLGNDPAERSNCGKPGPKFGWIVRVRPSGNSRLEEDLAGYEAANNPDGGVPDSDPYGILWNGTSTIATDAGGNDLLQIDHGSISTLATFPSRAQGRYTDSVPTTVAVGPDGAYYVGELTGAPFTPGNANVYRVVPGQQPTVFASGFSFIVDLIFDSAGNMYVLEFATGSDLSGPGDLIRVEPNGNRTVIATGFAAPGNVTIGPDKRFYVSNCSIFPGTGDFPCHGEVVRFKG